MTLNDIKPGSSCTVEQLECSGEIRRRILDMGLTRGVAVKVLKEAPLKDPIEIELRGYNLSLRRSDAAKIEVIPVGDEKR